VDDGSPLEGSSPVRTAEPRPAGGGALVAAVPRDSRSDARTLPHDGPARHQARAALDTVEHSRRLVVDEIDVTAGYWASVAAGWIVLGAIADLNHPWAITAATLACHLMAGLS
jgi:hypothetical protein